MAGKSKVMRKGGRNGQQSKDKMDEEDLDVNTLLNFRLPPRNLGSSMQHPAVRRNRRGPYAVWNKEKFINAQYRFAMHPSGDYVAHFADPDIYFQWKDIAQVIIPRQSPLDCHGYLDPALTDDNTVWSCPICLSPPVAPRITKCGHIFCYPCFLHYLTTTTQKWAKCPICLDSITESQLKPVRWFDQATDLQNPTPNHRSSVLSYLLPMRLMFRPTFTTFALPVSTTWPSEAVPPLRAPFHFLPDVERFARFMLATPEYLQAHYTTELGDLMLEGKEREKSNDPVGLVFVEEAASRVRGHAREIEEFDVPKVNADIDDRLYLLSKIPTKTSRGLLVTDITEGSPHRHVGALNSHTGSPSIILPSPTGRRNVNPPSKPGSYYFYMAANGRYVFLHPLDIRILLSKYSRYSQFPSAISLQVDAFVETSVDADLRKRCKYLAHLPEGSDVVFVEADLEPIVGKEVLQHFEVALRMRRQRRLDKERKEERARIKAESSAREREMEAGVWRDMDRIDFGPQIDGPVEIDNEPQPPNPDLSSPGEERQWRGRSFAAAAKSSGDGIKRNSVRPETEQETNQDFEFEAAWQDLEDASHTRKGRQKQLVILGSSGGRRRR